MNNRFLEDSGKQYYYLDLIDDINRKKNYFQYAKEQDLYKYFTNFIFALINDLPITLIDSDLSEQEISILGIGNINLPVTYNSKIVNNVEELSALIRKSDSTITIFTSGTTGQPKKVTHSLQNLARNVKINDSHKNDIWGFAYNPTHMAGIQVFLQAIYNGNTLINLFNKPRIEVYSQILNNKITHISGTPTFYRLLLPMENQYGSVKRITFGGEKSDNKLYENIQKIFPNAKVINVYASTEAGSLFASRGSDFKIPYQIKDKIKVVNSELYIHKDLLGNSESLKLDDEFYPSGDLIEWVNEKDGLFRFKSRKNELINVGGYKVNPHEVEEAILNLDGIKDVRVFGKPNSVLGTILCADVVKDSESNVSEMEIRKYLSESLQDFKIPRRIKFVDKLELTRTGKLKR